MKARKCLLKIIAVGSMAGMIVSVNMINVGAVTNINTGNYYMGGYKLYGSLTVYSTHAEGFTFCENTSAGKSARTVYSYYNTDGVRKAIANGSSGYTYNNKNSLSVVTPNADASIFDYYAGAVTYSKVIYPNATQYSWTSDGTDTELRLGCYKRW